MENFSNPVAAPNYSQGMMQFMHGGGQQQRPQGQQQPGQMAQPGQQGMRIMPRNPDGSINFGAMGQGIGQGMNAIGQGVGQGLSAVGAGAQGLGTSLAGLFGL